MIPLRKSGSHSRSVALYLLHGALGSATQLAPLVAELADAGDVRTFEFAGHGDTPLGDRQFTIDGFVQQLLEELDRAGVERADLFGYSMGGYVALSFALACPERVGRVFTLGTKFAWTPEVAAREAARCDPVKIRAKVPAFADELSARHAGAGGWEGTLARTADLLRGLGDRPLLGAEELARVTASVCLMVGDRDATVSTGETSWASERLPTGELAVLPGTPHSLEEVDQRMLAWLLTRELP